MQDEVRPWDRLPQESDRNWEAFQAYLHMPKPRPPMIKFCKKFDVAYITFRGWASRNFWKDRITAYDSYVHRRQMAIEIGEDQAVPQVAKSEIVVAEKEDYDKLREGWTKAADAVLRKIEGGDELAEAIVALNQLALARQRIQVLARRAAKMPFTYAARDEIADEKEREPGGELFLDFQDGPTQIVPGRLVERTEIYGSQTSTASPAPADSERSDREI